MNKHEVDIKSLITLDRYLAILLDSYPNPVTASELADKAGLSKPAVSKVRERLIQVCDPKSMMFDRGFLLSAELDNMQKLFFVFAATGRHRKFLSSKLIRTIISKKAIHPKLVARFPLYEKYFNPDDTEFIFTKFLDIAARIEPKDFSDLIKITYFADRASLLDYRNIPKIDPIIKKLNIKLNNETELMKLFSIRDKLFLLIRDTIWGRIEKMQILEGMENEKRTNYLSVYKHTTDFYLKMIFKELNAILMSAAKDLSIKPDTLPIEIGSTVVH